MLPQETVAQQQGYLHPITSKATTAFPALVKLSIRQEKKLSPLVALLTVP